jgi:mycobactin phenyloxazoline synthetase
MLGGEVGHGTTIARHGDIRSGTVDVTTLHGSVLAAAAAAGPDATAVRGASGETTYTQLADQVRSIGAALTVAGVAPGDGVAVVGTACAEQIPAMLGVLAAGATYVPVAAGLGADAAIAAMRRGGVRMVLVCGDLPPAWAPALTVREALRVGAADRGFVPVARSADNRAAAILATATAPDGRVFSHAALLDAIGRHRTAAVAVVPALDSEASVAEVFAPLLAGAGLAVVHRGRAVVPAVGPVRFLPTSDISPAR